MRVLAVDPAALPPDQLLGRVVCADVPDPAGGRALLLRKGQRLAGVDLPKLAQLGGHALHLVELEPSDVHEDEAAIRLAQSAAGPGVELRPPAQSRVNLVAASRGLLKIDAAALEQVNLIRGITVFTLYGDLAVEAGTVVAGAKITPLAIPNPVLAKAEAIARAGGGIVRVVPFRPTHVGVFTHETLEGRARQKFRAALAKKLAWFGSELLDFVQLPAEAGAVAAAIRDLVDRGAGMMLTAGGNSVDPADPNFLGLELAGAQIERHGMPSHPGSTYWLAYVGGVPILGLASCGMFSQATLADLLLPRLLAGERPTQADLAQLGYGGLLDRRMAFRFPPYGDLEK